MHEGSFFERRLCYEPVDYNVARWIGCADRKKLAEFEKRNIANLAKDAEGCLSYLTVSEWQLNYCQEQWPDIAFYKTRDVH